MSTCVHFNVCNFLNGCICVRVCVWSGGVVLVCVVLFWRYDEVERSVPNATSNKLM